MEIASLTPALDELERAIAWAAQPTGIPSEHRIVPTIQTRGRRRACGWFLQSSWSTREGELCHEINFCAEMLDSPVEDIVETAVHESRPPLVSQPGSQGLLRRMAEELRPDVAKFALFRLASGSRKAPTKMMKWTCGCVTVRCAVDLEATCDRCGGVFVVVV